MPPLFRTFFFMLLAAGALVACKENESKTQTTEPATGQAGAAREKIVQILTSYYQALEAQSIRADQFFAPQVDQFFSAANLTSGQIDQMLQAGFSTASDRQVTLDESSIQVSPAPEGGWTVVFTGEQSYTRASDGAQVKEAFQNQVGFNADFKIVAYQSLSAASRGLPAREGGIATVAPQVLGLLRAKQTELINRFIDPEKGLIFVVQPGAFRLPSFVRSAADMYAAPTALQQAAAFSCTPSMEPIPDFDCENGFSKEGCFLAPVQAFKGFTELMRALNEAGATEYSPADFAQAAGLEALITMKLVDTRSGIGIYLGQIGGQWRLIAVDTAEYECAA